MKQILDNLHVMLCQELDEISRRGISKHDDLDMVKDLLESIDHIYSISDHQDMNNNMMGKENGMSQNSYRGGNSYRNYTMRGNSYANDPYMNGNSNYNPHYDPYYNERSYVITPRDRGYSGATQEEMLKDLKKMEAETSDARVKEAISECIAKMEK